jgi:P-type Ca2+ transporter type 2C
MGSYYFENPPLNAFQILWINLIMDSLAALSISDEPYPLEVIGNEHKQDISLITMGKAVVRQTIYQIVVIWLIILQGEVLFNIPYSEEYSQIQDSPDLVA